MLAQVITPARAAGPGSLDGVTEVQLQSNYSADGGLRIVRIAQSVTPVTVIHSIASAQSRVTTLHLIAHELLVFLVVPLATAVPAPHGIGDRGHSGPPHLILPAHRPQTTTICTHIVCYSEVENGIF
jgi:hypothetical protein